MCIHIRGVLYILPITKTEIERMSVYMCVCVSEREKRIGAFSLASKDLNSFIKPYIHIYVYVSMCLNYIETTYTLL